MSPALIMDFVDEARIFEESGVLHNLPSLPRRDDDELLPLEVVSK